LFADMPIFMKQAHAAGLTKNTKFVFSAAGFQHTKLEKSFTPEGMILGHNTMYFEQPGASALLKEFVRDYQARYKEPPHFEADRAYFTIAAYKAAIEKAAKATGGKWPSTEQVAEALRGIEVESLGGKVRYRADQIPECNFYAGFTTHKNSYEFCTIDRIEAMHTNQLQKPAGADFFKWIETMNWKV
jgi:branched-chain amino acid transport system substrate-binding protein